MSLSSDIKHQNNHKPFTINHNILFSPRHYRMFALGLFAFLLAFLASAALTPVSSSSAQEITYQHNATGYYITVANSDTVSLSAEATNNGTLVSASDTVNVKTNSPLGYRLYVSASNSTDKSNNLYKNGDPANSVTGYFKPVAGTLETPAVLAKNTWGFALAQDVNNSYSSAFSTAENYSPTTSPTEPTASSTWAAVPVADNAQIIKQTNAKTSDSGDDTEIYYGINATTQVISGEYSNTITYTAFSDVINDSQGTMQNFTIEQCNKIPEDSFIILTDSRDGKDYMVSHLKDGNCWMTQNLALGPADSETDLVLTPADSNVTTTRTIPGSSLVDGNGNTPSAYDTPQIVTTFQDKTDDYGSFYGNYYNWNAATAGVGLQTTKGTVYESICPRGWRLPDNSTWGETDATGNKIKSYVNLIGNYTVNVDGTGEQMPTENGTSATAITRIQQTPLYFPLAGHYNRTITGQGTYGGYWSRTIDKNTPANVYNLRLNASIDGFGPHGSAYKYYGFSVRCVFGENEANYMQNFTAEMCNSLTQATNGLTEDVRRALMDSRDGKLYNVSRMADNNCWMVSNLALDGIDGSTSKGRTLTTADTNIDAAEVGSDSVTFPDTTDITSGASKYNVPQIYTLSQDKTTTNCSSYPNTCVVSDVSYGNYYNWHAATAMQGDENTTSATMIRSSVCPKNWRLPDNGTEDGAKTYSNLVSSYTTEVDGSGDPMPTGNDTNAAAVKRVQQAPLYFPLSGRYNSDVHYQGIAGGYWSRTTSGTTTYSYYLDFNVSTSHFDPQANHTKADGFSVRCVFGE